MRKVRTGTKATGFVLGGEMDGKRYYEAAILLTDRHCKRFCDMLAEDFRQSEFERDYFTGEFRGLELMGWATFCERMANSGQGTWLEKIERLDEQVMMNLLEKRMMDAMEGRLSDSGNRVIDRDGLDAAVKALQGLVGRSKILSEQKAEEDKSGTIEIRFIGSAGSPTGELPKLDSEVESGSDSAEQSEAQGASRTEI